LSLSVGGLLLRVNNRRRSPSYLTMAASAVITRQTYMACRKRPCSAERDGDRADVNEHAHPPVLPVSVISTSVATPQAPWGSLVP